MSWALPCPAARYTEVVGQTVCKICNGSAACSDERTQTRTGTELLVSQRNRLINSCLPGTYRVGEGPGCDVCPLGEFIISQDSWGKFRIIIV